MSVGFPLAIPSITWSILCVTILDFLDRDEATSAILVAEERRAREATERFFAEQERLRLAEIRQRNADMVEFAEAI